MTTHPGESLPVLLVTIRCGSCGGTTDVDDDGEHVCRGCYIKWGGDPFTDEPATFMDEDDPACLEPPEKPTRYWTRPTVYFHGKPVVEQQYTSYISPCVLPKKHRGHHFHPETTIRKVVTL